MYIRGLLIYWFFLYLTCLQKRLEVRSRFLCYVGVWISFFLIVFNWFCVVG
jgi:hypothetical protein